MDTDTMIGALHEKLKELNITDEPDRTKNLLMLRNKLDVLITLIDRFTDNEHDKRMVNQGHIRRRR